MFLDFLLYLREGGLKVSLNEWLALMEAMHMGLHNQTVRGFYVLCRTLLIKKETDIDKFDEMFYRYFKDVTSEELQREMEKLLHHPEVADEIFGEYMCRRGLDSAAVRKAMQSRLGGAEGVYSENRAAGDDSMTESVSAGEGEAAGSGNGTMIQGGGGKSVIHAQGDRKFRDWRTDCSIESRQFQMAFRLLRELSRKLETSQKELDIRGTIDSTCRQGGILDIKMQPPRKNRLKLMVLIDSGGSMRPYEQLCSLLFQSLNKANTFSDLKIYYFHNYVEEELYKDPSIDTENTVKTEWVLRNIAPEYKVIFVGDADMAIYELVGSPYGGASGNDGLTWFKKFRQRYKHSIWLHPQEREENIAWMGESFVEIEKVFPMFRLSIDGLKDGMYKLMKSS